jgi:hypothetical protein
MYHLRLRRWGSHLSAAPLGVASAVTQVRAVGVLQLLKCATQQDPAGSLLSSTRQNGLQRPRTPGGVGPLVGNQHGTAGARAQGTRQ